MTKLGIDHPYHVLYQLLSLTNGNRDNKGQVDNSGSSKGGLQQNVDVDKIQAATAVIRKIAQHPSRSLLSALQDEIASTMCWTLLQGRMNKKELASGVMNYLCDMIC